MQHYRNSKAAFLGITTRCRDWTKAWWNTTCLSSRNFTPFRNHTEECPRYVQWLANIVLVMKKNRKLRVCVDFRDLNAATPKDMYVMPIVDMLVDSTANNELLSFMDSFSRYNQILIAIDDIFKTAFRCLSSLGTFEWMVMPFGLKNVGATYQKAMNAIFHDMLGHHMQIYIDDIMVKSKKVAEHVNHLRKSFERMRLHQLKLNSLKCAFRVQAENFLGFLVH